MHEKIILRKEGDIGFMEINNPPENYLDRPDFIKMEDLKAFVNSGIKALVISGAGRHFSAGADIDQMKKQIGNVNAFTNSLAKGNLLLDYIDELEIPVIASITGVCFGAGLEIALACDIRYCDEKSLFAFPEVNHDLIPGLSGLKRLISIAGKKHDLEITLKGDMMDATKAFDLGIIDHVVEKKKSLETATRFAQSITNNRSLKVINAIMRSIRNHEKLPGEEAVVEDIKLFAELANESFKE